MGNQLEIWKSLGPVKISPMNAHILKLLLLVLLVSGQIAYAGAIEISEAQRAVVVVETDSGQGSGVLLESSGVLVTSLHVIESATDISVKTQTNETYDDVSVIDFDETKDIALLKIKGFDLPTAKLGNSNSVKSGQDVFAVGTPLGYEQTVSRGIVSAVRMMDGGFKSIQTDAAISPGSSGGGLFNDSSELIAVLAAYRGDGQNLNFAVPINYVRGMMGQPVKYSEAEFIKLNVFTPTFGESHASLSSAEKLDSWIQKFSDEFDGVNATLVDNDLYLLTVDNANLMVSLIDPLLWIQLPFDDEYDFDNEQLSKLLYLSKQIDYAYLSMEENKIAVGYEMDIEGSSYKAFYTGVLAVMQGAFQLADELAAFDDTDSSSSEKPSVPFNEDHSGLRHAEPSELGIEVGYRAFDWEREQSDDQVVFSSKNGDRSWAQFFVEELEFEATNNDYLELVLTNYLENHDRFDEVSVAKRGFRKVGDSTAAWAEYSAVSQGMKIHWHTTTLLFHDRLVTLHVWSGKPDWELLDETTVEMLRNIRLKQ